MRPGWMKRPIASASRALNPPLVAAPFGSFVDLLCARIADMLLVCTKLLNLITRTMNIIVCAALGSSSGSHQLYHDWQELPAPLPPTLEQRDPAAHVRAVLRRQAPDHFDNLTKPALAFFDFRQDLVPQKTRDQLAQLGDRLVMRRAAAGDQHHPDGACLPEKAQALAGGAPADAQPLDQLLHRQGIRGQEEHRIDFGVGTRLAHDPRNLNKQADDLRFQVARSEEHT